MLALRAPRIGPFAPLAGLTGRESREAGVLSSRSDAKDSRREPSPKAPAEVGVPPSLGHGARGIVSVFSAGYIYSYAA